MDQTNERRPASVTGSKQLQAIPSQQAGETRDRWKWVEQSVWTKPMLSRLMRNEEKDQTWFRLWDKVYAPANLQSAYESVRANKGGAGADWQTVEHFAKQAPEELKRLHEQLREGSYRAQPARRHWIPKPGSKEMRPLGIPAVRDRVAETALLHVIEPIFERTFAEQSYGFRPGRGCKDALRRVDKLLREGNHWVVDADLKSYFDTIPHEPLMERVREKIADGKVLELIEHYLKAGVMEELKGWQPTEKGTPQGAVISPLLANIYLNPLDHEMEQARWEMVRYADDFVILCRDQKQAEAALETVKAWTEKRGLRLHPEKTRIIDASQPGGFDFLGYHFERGMKWPRRKSMDKLKNVLREKTSRLDGREIKEIIKDVNQSLRGWYGYFKQSKSNVFPMVDGFVRRRLRSVMQWRRDGQGNGRGRAQNRWPNRWFEQQGLYTLKSAHAFTVTILKLRTH